jgi:glycosyltransferase involved in cell wall biosynthesis
MDNLLRIWIFVPIYNFEKYLTECLESILLQTHTNYRIVAIIDGSTDKSSKILSEFASRLPMHSIHLPTNMGGGFTKWTAIQYVRAHGCHNDIFTIIDGDDLYSTPTALATIANTFLEKRCWLTSGSATGEYCFPLTELKTGRVKQFQFMHPRSCLVSLLHYLTAEDFKDKSGKWLMRYTEFLMLYKLSELAGNSRISPISDIIYMYRSHPENARKRFNDTITAENIMYIKSLKPYTPICEDIHVIMCCYKRWRNLPAIIKHMNTQTVASRIVFHIINTNPERWVDVQKAIPKTICKILLYNTGANLYGFARFLLTKKLMRETILPYVIYVDDDQVLPPSWVEDIYAKGSPLTMASWYGRVFKRQENVSYLNYWLSDITYTELVTGKQRHIDSFDYAGTCGCIVDTNVFLSDMVFKCSLEYRNGMEDLWLSFVIRKVWNKPLPRLYTVPIVNHFADTEETALYRTVMPVKTKCLRLCAAHGYLNDQPIGTIMDIGSDDSEELIARCLSSPIKAGIHSRPIIWL